MEIIPKKIRGGNSFVPGVLTFTLKEERLFYSREFPTFRLQTGRHKRHLRKNSSEGSSSASNLSLPPSQCYLQHPPSSPSTAAVICFSFFFVSWVLAKSRTEGICSYPFFVPPNSHLALWLFSTDEGVIRHGPYIMKSYPIVKNNGMCREMSRTLKEMYWPVNKA